MLCRKHAHLNAIDRRLGQMTVGWLGAAVVVDDESGDDVEDIFDEDYISALISSLTVALQNCEKEKNIGTITALKAAWNACTHAVVELKNIIRRSRDATWETDLHTLGKYLDEHREEVFLQTLSDSNYHFWNPPADDPMEWIMDGAPADWNDALKLRHSLVRRIFMYGCGLNSSDSFTFALTLESESQFQPLLTSIQSVIDMIKQPVITSAIMPPVLRSFSIAIHADREKIQGIINWIKAFGIKNSLTGTVALFEQRINAGSVGSGYLQFIEKVHEELRKMEYLVSSQLVVVCLIPIKHRVFKGEISIVRTKLKELADRCIADVKRFQPDKEVKSSWDSEISRLLDNIECYEARLQEGDFRKEYIEEILLLRVQYQQLIPVLKQTHIRYVRRIETAYDSTRTFCQADLDKLERRMVVAQKCDTAAGILIERLRHEFPDYP
jgi:hypothetical protein